MNKIFKNLLIFITLLGLLGLMPLAAQELQTNAFSGQVVDESGNAMSGVTVKAFNLRGSTVTDANGGFTISVTRDIPDNLVIDEPGFNVLVFNVEPGQTSIDPLIVVQKQIINPDNIIDLPYGSFNSNRAVGSVSVITGDELASYPSDNLLEALIGRVPGLVINHNEAMPGQESFGVSIRGVGATIYIDGVPRDITGLSASEVDKVEVFKDLSSRAQLGLSGSNPIIWITTKAGERYNRKISVSTEYGFRNPTTMPNYLDAFNYATLYNEALDNDGLTARYLPADLAGYSSQSNPNRYPDINYYDQYLRSSAPFSKGDISFQGGDDKVKYFSAFNFLTTEGLESEGQAISNNRYKIRGNVDIKLNDFMKLGINITGSYNKQRYPNSGGGAGIYNIFNTISNYPSNAHPIYFGDKLIISDDYPSNVTNELLYAGYAQGQVLNAQNSAHLAVDLGGILEGLSFDARASFDIMNNIIQNQGGTAALYRMQTTSLGTDTAVLIVPQEVDVTMSIGNNTVSRRTEAMASLNYIKEVGKHSLIMNAVYYSGLDEGRVSGADYQPDKYQDLSLRANYAFDEKYIIQADIAYSGSMRMPQGERFSIYPTFGAAWVASKEGFLSSSSVIDYLKFNASYGIMGVGNFYLNAYNPYYLFQTLWNESGSWRPGVPGSYGYRTDIYNILQTASTDFKLPKKRYFNFGVQGQVLAKALSFEFNYFNELNYDKISNRIYTTPSIIGTQFLSATNYGEDKRWGVDGMLQYSRTSGDLGYSFGVNALYMRGKYQIVDESAALEDYRKLAGTDMDLFWMYNSEGLYQSATEITSRDVTQSWGDVQPGDIRYEDKNNDGTVDEKDVYATGAHSPRIFYGTNLNLSYKGVGLMIAGQGVADGDIMLTSSRYFRINGTKQNYSELMLDRWPETNDIPRLTTISNNNIQNSSFWVRKAAYFKIKNVELSYRLPANVSRMLFMTNSRIFVRATNLLTFSGLNKYDVDPENISAGISEYPIFRTYTAGVSFSF